MIFFDNEKKQYLNIGKDFQTYLDNKTRYLLVKGNMPNGTKVNLSIPKAQVKYHKIDSGKITEMTADEKSTVDSNETKEADNKRLKDLVEAKIRKMNWANAIDALETAGDITTTEGDYLRSII